MLNKRIIIIIFLFSGFLFLQAYAWPWDSPEVKARKLVNKLEEYSLKIDRLEEIDGLGWDPFFQRLSEEIKESGDVIIPILIKEVSDTSNSIIYRYLCQSFLVYVKIKDKESGDRIIATLINLLRDKNEAEILRNRAADDLLTTGKQSKEIEGESMPWYHWITILTKEDRKEIVDNLLIVALDDNEGVSENSVRWHAIRALVTYNDYIELIIDNLSKYLNNFHQHLKAITINTIGGLGVRTENENIKKVMIDELKKGESGLAAERVLFWIKRLEIREATSLLIISLETGKYCSKVDAADILGKWKVKEAESALIHLLKTGKNLEKYKAVEALGNIGSRDAVEPLIEIIERHGSLTRVAAKALGKIGDSKAIEPIMEVFKEAEKYNLKTSEELPMALMVLGARESISLIEERYDELQKEHPHSEIWRAVNENLQKFKKGENVKYRE